MPFNGENGKIVAQLSCITIFLSITYQLPINYPSITYQLIVLYSNLTNISVEYLIMNPIKGFEDFHKMISVESWLRNVKGYDVGHRGAGIARRTDRIENILENTIASFNFASLHVRH